jgi:hypothetical protein
MMQRWLVHLISGVLRKVSMSSTTYLGRCATPNCKASLRTKEMEMEAKTTEVAEAKTFREVEVGADPKTQMMKMTDKDLPMAKMVE